ncbi:MAG: hypothetical protein IT270_10995 [Saprospiraceae bacterium]|nr:hypothetical protein [Saprospiraceae bacterium]
MPRRFLLIISTLIVCMTQENTQNSKGRKIAISIALGIILIVLPGISWIYLRNGLNWRKTAQAELKEFGKVRSAPVIYADGTKYDRIDGKVCVIHFFGDDPQLTEANKKIIEDGQKLFDQFGQNDAFRLVMVSKEGSSEFRSHYQKLPSIDYATWVWSGATGSWKTILMNGYESYCLQEGIKPAEEYYALADTSGTIRRYYDALDDQQVARMVQHVAILLPKE